MPPIDAIRAFHDELTAIRRDFHANPELGLEEHRTAEIVAKQLEAWGIEVHRGVGVTGVVGVLRKGSGKTAIGLRADMDCLPMDEQTNLPYRSQSPGRMHACGHDGHTTMLLGAARYLATSGDFDGTVNFIFQPGEEGIGGALAMLKDGLFERFPCDAIFAMHNRPGMEVGEFAIAPGPSAAGGAFFDIAITGRGAHGARPEASIDPLLVACHITTALQSIVARNVPPADTAVLSVTRIVGGDAYNVIPQSATISGTARTFRKETMELIETGMKRIAKGVAEGFGATAEVDFRVIFAPLINDPAQTDAIADAAAALVGEDKVDRAKPPGMGSEDFSFMMEQVPGAYIQLGNGDSAQLHNPAYNFNDEATPYGAALLASLVERKLARASGG
ncbi:M20 aminoacylase family protein [Limobrevibacterium gyesilva]|uniref:M20 family metallopeptidase n=1 Tax=Limobrevibacterium gyesilva TaxID=2991712 RepID=A0AA41YRA5_9PROT|nr:M20 aminoacylase family protein [Limobrevibacterium gyesilva]MCW3475060.1 M20 family metallopeptidase [Limobrevibacterium gyesilva]